MSSPALLQAVLQSRIRMPRTLVDSSYCPKPNVKLSRYFLSATETFLPLVQGQSHLHSLDRISAIVNGFIPPCISIGFGTGVRLEN